MMLRIIAAVIVSGSVVGEGAAQADPVRVVATLPVYADLVEKIGGAGVDVSAIAAPLNTLAKRSLHLPAMAPSPCKGEGRGEGQRHGRSRLTSPSSARAAPANALAQ